MTLPFTNINRLLFPLLLCLGIIACREQPGTEAPRYSLFVMTPDQQQYIWHTDGLDSGRVDPVQQGTLLPRPPRIWYYLSVRNGYYYYVDPKTEFLVKGKLDERQFVALDSVHLPDFSYPDNSVFMDDSTLLLINHSVGRRSKRFAKVNVATMEAHTGDLPLEVPRAPFDNMSVGFVYKRQSTLWLGYTYHYTNQKMGYGSADTVYIAQLSYPDMRLKRLEKDARSTYPGNVNTAQQNTFEDEKGDFYFMSTPGIARGANIDQPTAIYRIKAGEDHLDSSYFYNVSASGIQNHAYGLWYLGNNKALVRSERKDLFKTFKDHYLLPHIEYYEIDLNNPQHTYKLPLPLDRGTSRTCVLPADGKTYITINYGKGNNDIWVYEAANRKLHKGLHLDGPIDYIFRLDPLRGQ